MNYLKSLTKTACKRFMNAAVQAACEAIIGEKIRNITPVSGGSINQARRIDTAAGSFFVKMNRQASAKKMFEAEARGLELLQGPGVIRIPKAIGSGEAGGIAFLVLEHIEASCQRPSFLGTFRAAARCPSPRIISTIWVGSQ